MLRIPHCLDSLFTDGCEVVRNIFLFWRFGIKDREGNKTDMAASLIECTREQQFEGQIL
jgi:hypothetical protein